MHGDNFILITIMSFSTKTPEKSSIISKYSQGVSPAELTVVLSRSMSRLALEEFACSDTVGCDCQQKCEGWCVSIPECSNEQHHIYSNYCL